MFSFATPVRIARIVKSPDCTAALKVGINREEDSDLIWDEWMATDERRLRIDGVEVTQLVIQSDDAVVYGTDFVVYGWE